MACILRMRQNPAGIHLPSRKMIVGRDKQFRAVVEPVDRFGGFQTNFNFSLKGLKGRNKGRYIPENAVRRQHTERKADIIGEISESSPNCHTPCGWYPLPKRCWANLWRSSLSRIFRSLAIIFRLSFFSSKPECSSSTLIRLMAALTESFWALSARCWQECWTGGCVAS